MKDNIDTKEIRKFLLAVTPLIILIVGSFLQATKSHYKQNSSSGKKVEVVFTSKKKNKLTVCLDGLC